MIVSTFSGFLKTLQGESEKLFKLRSFNWYMAQIKAILKEGFPYSPEKSASTLDIQKIANESFKQSMTKTIIFPQDKLSKISDGTSDGMPWNLIGKMLMFVYDAKLKDTLPYWDKFPLIFLIQTDGTHSLGINMHYLPPYERAKLMQGLYGLINNKELDEKTRLNMTYQTLKGASRLRYYKPCIKSYLTTHIRSKVYIISAKEWDNVLLLPLANFQKAKDFRVWQDSLNILKK